MSGPGGLMPRWIACPHCPTPGIQWTYDDRCRAQCYRLDRQGCRFVASPLDCLNRSGRIAAQPCCVRRPQSPPLSDVGSQSTRFRRLYMSHQTGTVRLHRVLKAPAERIYKAFTSKDALEYWLPPYGFTGTVHEIDA